MYMEDKSGSTTRIRHLEYLGKVRGFGLDTVKLNSAVRQFPQDLVKILQWVVLQIKIQLNHLALQLCKI